MEYFRNEVENMKLAFDAYCQIIRNKKVAAHEKGILYIEINAGDLLDECEPKVANVKTVCAALIDELLEGDYIVSGTKTTKKLTVRYYCDNLHPSRRKLADCE